MTNVIMFILGILSLGAMFALKMFHVKQEYIRARQEGTAPQKTKSNLPLMIAGIALIIGGLCFTIVPTGFTGVRTTFGQISDKPLANNINFKLPIVQNITLVNNKIQETKNSDVVIWGETSEKVPISMSEITITYQISADKSAWIVANVSDYENNLINSGIISSALKDATVKFNTVEVTVRSNIEPRAQDNLQKALDGKYGVGTVTIGRVTIGNMDFTEQYNSNIAQKNAAQMAYEQAQIENKKKIESAQASADALLIESKAKAEANQIMSDSITEKLLIDKSIDKWNGVRPYVESGDSNGLIFDIGGMLNGTK